MPLCHNARHCSDLPRDITARLRDTGPVHALKGLLMNIPVLIVAVITALAVIAHVLGGTRETAALAPSAQNSTRSAHWVQAMCAFQMLSVDLIVVTGLLFTIALTDVLPFEARWITGLCLLFLAWGVVWVIQMLMVKRQGVTLMRLPHFLVWFVCAGLLWLGI